MPSAETKPKTLYDKVFDAHVVNEQEDGTVLLYIDRHLVHEVTSPVSVFTYEPTTLLQTPAYFVPSKHSKASRTPAARSAGRIAPWLPSITYVNYSLALRSS